MKKVLLLCLYEKKYKPFKTFKYEKNEIFVVKLAQLKQLDAYNKETMTAMEIAGDKLLKHFRENKILVFRDERRKFLLPFLAFFNATDSPDRKTPPRIIAQFAMQMADFAYDNTNERYLAEDEVSRYIQKLQREQKDTE